MAVVIRMKRTGRRNRPCYRISVADSRMPRDGRTLETLGIYDPIAGTPETQLTVDVERSRVWITQGAKPSHTVRNMFRRAGVYAEGFAKPKPARQRPGRKKDTATKTRRAVTKQFIEKSKAERRNARTAAKAAVKQAAPAAEPAE